MDAKAAYELAAAQNNVDHVLAAIKTAAAQGKTEVVVPLLNTFQYKKLVELGYMTYPEARDIYGGPLSMMAGRHEPTHHIVRWDRFDKNEMIDHLQKLKG